MLVSGRNFPYISHAKGPSSHSKNCIYLIHKYLKWTNLNYIFFIYFCLLFSYHYHFCQAEKSWSWSWKLQIPQAWFFPFLWFWLLLINLAYGKGVCPEKKFTSSIIKYFEDIFNCCKCGTKMYHMLDLLDFWL